MKISVINANINGNKTENLRCEKICCEIESVFALFDEIEITRKPSDGENIRLVLFFNETESAQAIIKIFRAVFADNGTKILQSAVFNSIKKYTGIKAGNINPPVTDNRFVTSSPVPAILLETKYSCDANAFGILAQDIARGAAFATAGFIKAQLKAELAEKNFYVKPFWDESRCAADRFYGYDSALQRARLSSENIYNSDGDCLAVYGIPPQIKKISAETAQNNNTVNKKRPGFFSKIRRKHLT